MKGSEESWSQQGLKEKDPQGRVGKKMLQNVNRALTQHLYCFSGNILEQGSPTPVLWTGTDLWPFGPHSRR